MPEPEHERLATAARWCGLLALVVVPASALGMWLGLRPLFGDAVVEWASWGAIGPCLSLAGSAAGLVLLGVRAGAVLGGLQEALEESKRRQAHLRAIVDTAADAILTCDGQGRILTANAAAGRLFGYPLPELVGVPLNQLLLEAPLDSVRTDRHKVLVTAAASAAARRADGGSFPVTVSISKVRLEGQPLFLVIIHDLTALTEARRKAEESGRARSAFLLLMSHELRTPLSEVLGMAGLLAETALTPEQRRLLATLSQSSESLLAVEQLLDFSRLESGEASLERRPMSVRQVLFDAAGPLAAHARARGLRFTCVADDDVPPQVLGDPERLRAVLACLAGNAVKFSTSGEVELRVRRQAPEGQEAGECLLCFTVRDSGQNGRPGGPGLGLSMVSRLVSAMGGTIDQGGAPGQGPTFRVVLPFGLPAVADGPPPVLVVMADAAERAALECTLVGLGLPAVGASTGKAALGELLRAVVSGRPFGLVVLEDNLAGWDGPAEDWLRQVRECSDWRGGVVLLRDAGLGLCPVGATAVMARHEACARLGDLFGRHAG